MLWLYSWYVTYLVEGLLLALVVGVLALVAPRLISGEPKSLIALRSSMVISAMATLLVSLGIVYLLVEYLGGSMNIWFVIGFVSFIMLLQWLFSPHIINAVYRARPADNRYDWLKLEVKRISEISGLSNVPKLVIVDSDMPNAFAYGSPLTGNYIAVTRGLLNLLPSEEVKAVIGHEIGHLKHRDVPVILALSLLPTAIYFLGRTMIYWSMWGGVSTREKRDEGNAAITYMALGAIMLIAGFILHFIVTHFNRLREYYADANSVFATGSPQLLQRALARLHLAYKDKNMRAELERNKTVAMLFIVNYLIDMFGSRFYDPYKRGGFQAAKFIDIDEVVDRLRKEKINSFTEVFSTHPPIPKRIRFLDRLALRIGQ